MSDIDVKPATPKAAAPRALVELGVVKPVEGDAGEVTAAQFARVDPGIVTVVDAREPDEVLVHPLPGALSKPFSRLSYGFDDVPRGKPVLVICRTGDYSEQVAEILADRGYEAYNVVGGYDAYAKVLAQPIEIDATGLKCPGPIVKVADAVRAARTGQRFHVMATEDAFCSDLPVWCRRTGNRLVSLAIDPAGKIDAPRSSWPTARRRWAARSRSSSPSGG